MPYPSPFGERLNLFARVGRGNRAALRAGQRASDAGGHRPPIMSRRLRPDNGERVWPVTAWAGVPGKDGEPPEAALQNPIACF